MGCGAAGLCSLALARELCRIIGFDADERAF